MLQSFVERHPLRAIPQSVGGAYGLRRMTKGKFSCWLSPCRLRPVTGAVSALSSGFLGRARRSLPFFVTDKTPRVLMGAELTQLSASLMHHTCR